eukprot:TRINITY_DN32635_c0_g1_i1.p1 TRINITY_DN32635_c0_g1~~TRINITY_DN32635_c0_g1_i1.p1  ORF type:complete len:520 (+),score=112.70 TRINITY_DN32635_c0_g1_i1:119-1678(+)
MTVADGDLRNFRLGSTPGSFHGMPHITLKDMKGLTGAEVTVTTARKEDTWGVIPKGQSSASAVSGEKLLVEDGMKMPVKLVDVVVSPKDKKSMTGKADAFRGERGAWSVILPDSPPGSASLAGPGQISEKGSSERWAAPMKFGKVSFDGKEQGGLFAARGFSSGDCIFVESPFMMIDETAEVDSDMRGLEINIAHKKAIQKFVTLPIQLKQAILTMYCPERLTVTLRKGEEQWQKALEKDSFFEQIAKAGIEVGTDDDDKAVIWRFIRIWDANNMETAGGSGIFGCTCKQNHSCKPNIARVLLPGNQMGTFAITDIKEGDELTSSYLVDADLLKPKARRQEILRNWDFDCKCSRCQSETEEGPLTPQDEIDIEKMCSNTIKEIAKSGTLDLSETRSELENVKLPTGHWLTLQLLTAFRDLEKLEGNYLAARDRQADILKFWETAIPADVSIQRALVRGALGDVERQLGNYMDAFKHYYEGLAEVASFQFPGHTACVELRSKLQSLLTCDKGAIKSKSKK